MNGNMQKEFGDYQTPLDFAENKATSAFLNNTSKLYSGVSQKAIP